MEIQNHPMDVLVGKSVGEYTVADLKKVTGVKITSVTSFSGESAGESITQNSPL